MPTITSAGCRAATAFDPPDSQVQQLRLPEQVIQAVESGVEAVAILPLDAPIAGGRAKRHAVGGTGLLRLSITDGPSRRVKKAFGLEMEREARKYEKISNLAELERGILGWDTCGRS